MKINSHTVQFIGIKYMFTGQIEELRNESRGEGMGLITALAAERNGRNGLHYSKSVERSVSRFGGS